MERSESLSLGDCLRLLPRTDRDGWNGECEVERLVGDGDAVTLTQCRISLRRTHHLSLLKGDGSGSADATSGINAADFVTPGHKQQLFHPAASSESASRKWHLFCVWWEVCVQETGREGNDVFVGLLFLFSLWTICLAVVNAKFTGWKTSLICIVKKKTHRKSKLASFRGGNHQIGDKGHHTDSNETVREPSGKTSWQKSVEIPPTLWVAELCCCWHSSRGEATWISHGENSQLEPYKMKINPAYHTVPLPFLVRVVMWYKARLLQFRLKPGLPATLTWSMCLVLQSQDLCWTSTAVAHQKLRLHRWEQED